MEIEAQPNPPSPDRDCLICHHLLQIPCWTPCHHWYCGFCILDCWKRGGTSAFEPCLCPLNFCKAPITRLHPEASLHAHSGEFIIENLRGEVVRIGDVLRDVAVYNSFQAGGLSNHLFPRMRLTVSRMCRDTFNPRFPCAHIQIFRFIGLLIGFLFEACHIDVPKGLKSHADVFDVLELLIFVSLFILYVVGRVRAGDIISDFHPDPPAPVVL